jgi:glutathione S-transferase
VLGDDFTLADCAAAPALFYADLVEPLLPEDGMLGSYLARLTRRPSFARVLAEAEPWFGNFPLERKPSRERVEEH